ncbi:open beta-sheet domain-containing protein, partial [Salmonella enterica]
TDYEATTLEGILDKATDEAEGSYYMRVFGNELHYHHFRGLENFMETSGTTNPLEFLMDMARKGNVDYSKSYQMFDTHYIIP